MARGGRRHDARHTSSAAGPHDDPQTDRRPRRVRQDSRGRRDAANVEELTGEARAILYGEWAAELCELADDLDDLEPGVAASLRLLALELVPDPRADEDREPPAV